jgi:hypothetical protein
LKNEFADFLGLARSARLGWFSGWLGFICPAAKGAVGNDGENVLQLGAKGFAELHELGPLRRRNFNPFGQLGAEDSVLGQQVFDELSQLFVRESGDQQQQGVYESRHGHRMRKCLWRMEMTTF